MPDPAPLLEVQNVFAGYIRDLDILQGVNFKIYPGEMVAVIGPNGAGKSTLAKTIFGLLSPHQGSILFQGQSIAGLKSDRIVQLGMGYVPQIANVFRSLTVEENLEMGAFVQRNASLPALKEEIFMRFPKLAERRKQRAGTLSGGERQMLAMGKALMLKPTLLLLDEPSAALSPILVNSVFDQIKQINQAGTAIVLVEQNARKALEMSDRGYVLEAGRDRFEGSGAALLNNPKVGELYLGVTTDSL
ncbi:ABC transporter ATP-binding protein [Leptothermofonsia sichuanensis E412]|uniref:ABC transporter ATP-binding protein n=1 Tax=Leptothermofonsia sichuanensis TaxID=2917832 RepID=UPI001CA69436|nr:ABC transporter ATP-binding protein [Leptothermofonsia sichuanensis]QZZ21143.1 ABC transporter ATP-binding protein [Leptothermofonsia sichuanensis E412]